MRLTAISAGFMATLSYGQSPCPPVVVPPTGPLATKAAGLDGLYTDKPSYSPGESINVHANWGNSAVSGHELMRFDGTNFVTVGVPAPYSPQPYTLQTGSFVDFAPTTGSGLNLSGSNSFTIEGWYFPNYLFPCGESAEDIVLAGQIGVNDNDSTVGIGIRQPNCPGGESVVYGILRTSSGLHTITAPVVAGKGTALLREWNYVALTYNGSALKLYTRNSAGQTTGTLAVSGTVAPDPDPTRSSPYFRLGANLEAPGDRTGCFSGRLDRWSVFDYALGALKVQDRYELDPLPSPAPIMSCYFDETYGVGSYRVGTGIVGTVVNHGAQGFQGVDEQAALMIRHDQIVDARFPLVATFSPSPAWEPGLYVAQALTATPQPNHQCAFVVRPSAAQIANRVGKEIAVVLPVFSWLAYNCWPGARGTESEFFTAAGLSQRLKPTGAGYASQGNNSAYFDGHVNWSGSYMGWRRPNVYASTESATGEGLMLGSKLINENACPMNVRLLKWLHANAAAIGTSFDIYTDFDLHFGLMPTTGATRYEVIALTGHPEYWSDAMLNRIHSYMADGGNLLSAAGNVMTWRGEVRQRPVDALALAPAPNFVLEVRRWPFSPARLGPWDDVGWFFGQRMGAWRFLEQGQPSDAMRDLLPGTFNDLVGGMYPLDPEITSPVEALGQYGKWRQRGVPSFAIWGWPGVQTDMECSIIDPVVSECRYVGHETDRFLPEWLAPGFITNHVELAAGFDFSACDGSVPGEADCQPFALNWAHPIYNAANNTPELILAAVDNFVRYKAPSGEEHGSISYYRYSHGGLPKGRVLAIGCQNAVSSLESQPEIASLAIQALGCFLTGGSCP